jgi:anti-sigma-K factor RskA
MMLSADRTREESACIVQVMAPNSLWPSVKVWRLIAAHSVAVCGLIAANETR